MLSQMSSLQHQSRCKLSSVQIYKGQLHLDDQLWTTYLKRMKSIFRAFCARSALALKQQLSFWVTVVVRSVDHHPSKVLKSYHSMRLISPAVRRDALECTAHAPAWFVLPSQWRLYQEYMFLPPITCCWHRFCWYLLQCFANMLTWLL